MKAVFKLSFVLLFILFQYSCDKDKGGGGTTTTEETNLVIALNPDPGSTTTPVVASGNSYQFSVVIQSKMPPQGVEVKVEYRKDSDNSVIFSQVYSSTTTPVNVTITGIPLNEQGTVTVTVTSKSKTSNTASKTFKLIRK